MALDTVAMAAAIREKRRIEALETIENETSRKIRAQMENQWHNRPLVNPIKKVGWKVSIPSLTLFPKIQKNNRM